ncbi:MAG: radical SAM protein [Smithella sp.]|nr:radical SAM protein [Smithella sp.]
MPFRETTDTDFTISNLGFGIDITSHCNLNCITCYYINNPSNIPASSPSHMSMELFEKAMRQASLAGFQEIYILGGEPTIHARILDFLKCAADFKFHQVLLVTNGMLLADRDFCRKIEAAGTDLVVKRHVIGDGESDNKIQDMLVGKQGTLDQVNRAFANIESVFEPSRVAVQCCITRPVVESGQLFEVFRYAKTRGFGHVIECTKASDRFQRGNPLDLSPGELFCVYDRLQHIDVHEFKGTTYPMTPQAYGKTCHMPENSVHCLIDGTIVPCVGQPFPLGNIFTDAETSLNKIFDLPQRDFFRYPNLRIHGHCRNCSHFSVCTGGCRGDAFFLTGCFSASAVQCPQLSCYKEDLSRGDFLPANCDACKLRENAFCGPRKDADARLSRYLGSLYDGKDESDSF